MGGQDDPGIQEQSDVSYEWRLTSGGNTITETLLKMAEMLTTYSDDNGELVVKHYCALGTQPVFSVSRCQIPSWRWCSMSQRMIFTRNTRAL